MNAFKTMNHEYITFGTCTIKKLNSFFFFQFQMYVASFYVAESYVALMAATRNSIHVLFNFRLMMLRFMQPDPIFLLQLHLDFWSIGYHDQEAIDVVNEKLSRFA